MTSLEKLISTLNSKGTIGDFTDALTEYLEGLGHVGMFVAESIYKKTHGIDRSESLFLMDENYKPILVVNSEGYDMKISEHNAKLEELTKLVAELKSKL